MAEFLATIAEHVKDEVNRRRRKLPVSALRERGLFAAPARGFAAALRGRTRRIVAEIKKASPSRGVIRDDFSPLDIARTYAENGASAISVLTEERFFHGSLSYLKNIREIVAVPLLRKDFILDAYQVTEAKSYGADAILLIAALLDRTQMHDLREEAGLLSLDVLVEVHGEDELEAALAAGAQVVGINNRDLRTFEVSLATTERLAPLVPQGIQCVCESGIETTEQIRRVENLGIHAFLIGETLMRAPDPGQKLKELLKGEEHPSVSLTGEG
jgi:indole-3-glycerol phosphate synthase